MTLPPPAENQAYCNVSALDAGVLWVPDKYFIVPSDETTTALPCLVFLLHHSSRAQRFLFDLGVRKDVENSPPALYAGLKSGAFALSFEVPLDVVDSLALGGLSPNDIDYIALSHLHFDHVGNPKLFPNSTFFVHDGSKEMQFPGYPDDPNSIYDAKVPPPDQTTYLSTADWKPIGPFSRGYDFYGDGSLYIIDSPGHCPGHINLLVRTSSDGSWLYLAGDSAHNWHLVTGERKVAVGLPGNPHFCAHSDKAKAEEHIAHIAQLTELPRVQVLLAHDAPWYEKNKGGEAFWPGKIPPAK